jgi:hypothetical protein
MKTVLGVTLVSLLAVGGAGSAAGAPEAAAAAGAVRLRRFALLVGINDGGPARPRLHYATSDAQAMARVLESLGGVARPDLVMIADASRAAVDAGFAEIEKRLREGRVPGVRSELLLYYSGHSDDEGLLVGRDRMRYDELRARVQAAPADLRIVILDSCGSGAFTRQKGGTRRAPFLVDASIDTRGHAFLTSSAASEAAQESDRIAASFFTYFLVSGLRGAADANQDRRVTLQEAFQFASQETLARTERSQGGPQHAAYEFDLSGTGDMVVTDVRTTQAGILLTPELAGRIAVREASGALVAELRKPPGNTVELGVDPGAYVVAMEGGANMLEAKLTLVAGQHASLARASFHIGPRLEVAMARGDEAATADAPTSAAAVAEAAPAAVPPARAETAFRAGFWPRGGDGAMDVHGLSFGFIADRVGRLEGLQLTLAYAEVGRGGRGLQLSVGANVLAGDFRGTQISAGANVARGNFRGVELASGANVVDGDFLGLQAAAGVNVATGSMRGAQLAGGANLARTVSGLQAAGGANVAEWADGAQLAPINYAGSSHGAQIGVINAAGEAEGLRLGVVNAARRTRGFTLGVVNVAPHDDGESFGVLSFIGNGIHDVYAYATDIMLTNVGIKLGSRHLYTSFGVGYQPGDDLAAGTDDFVRGSRRYGFEGSVGWRLPLEQGWLSYLEVEAADVNLRSHLGVSGDWPQVASLRAIAGFRLAPDFAVIAGAGANVAIGTAGRDVDIGLGLPESVSRDGGTTVRVYPGLLLGFQI